MEGPYLKRHHPPARGRPSSSSKTCAAGIFGLPTYRFENELYWGQNSLPFLERYLNGETPIA
ncbi:hypothetical protein SAMN03159406_03172 [Rhizobium sp. NFR03]|nr:hypothetical protein SAMN03159406_03172 [Rhizobium sp. NFR03]